MKDVKKEKIDRDKAIRKNTAKHRKKRRRNLSIYYFMMLILTVSVLVVLSLTVFFKINVIEVEGAYPYSESAIVSASGIKKDQNLIMLSEEDVEKRILEKFIPIDSAKLIKEFPDKVIIDITLSENYFQIKTTDGLYLTVSSGFKVLEVGTERDESIMFVEGVKIDYSKSGEFINEKIGSSAEVIKKITEGLENKGIDKINHIVFNSSADIRATVYDGRLEIKLGSEANMDYKIELVGAVIKDKVGENEKGIVDASVEGTVTFLPE